MNELQILAVFNLVQNPDVSWVSITNFSCGPSVSVSLNNDVEVKKGFELVENIFPGIVLNKTGNRGQYCNFGHDVYLYVGGGQPD